MPSGVTRRLSLVAGRGSRFGWARVRRSISMPNKIAVRMQILGGVSVCPLMGLIGRYNFYPKVLGRYIEHLSQLSVTRTRPPYTTIDADNRRSQSSKFRTLGPWRAWGGPAVLRTCAGTPAWLRDLVTIPTSLRTEIHGAVGQHGGRRGIGHRQRPKAKAMQTQGRAGSAHVDRARSCSCRSKRSYARSTTRAGAARPRPAEPVRPLLVRRASRRLPSGGWPSL